MNLIRAVHNMYELLTSTKIDQLSKSVWSTVAAVLWSLFRGDSGAFKSGFIGEGCKPNAGGATPTVTLSPGLGLYFDATEPDLWRGKVKPIFLREPQLVEFDTNNSNQDRIDSVFIRPRETEEDRQERWLFDPIQKAEYRANEPGRVRYGFETAVIQGTPDLQPLAPNTPAGWLRVADVRRPSGQINVSSADVTDARAVMTIAPGSARLDNLSLKHNAEIYLEDGAGGFTRLFRGANASLNLVTNLVGALPDGMLNLGGLTAYSFVSTDALRSALDNVIEVFDFDGNTPAGLKLSFLRPHTGDAVQVQSAAGGSGGFKLDFLEASGAAGVWLKDKIRFFDEADFRAFIKYDASVQGQPGLAMEAERLSGGSWGAVLAPFRIPWIQSDRVEAQNVARAWCTIDGATGAKAHGSAGVISASYDDVTTLYTVNLEGGYIPDGVICTAMEGPGGPCFVHLKTLTTSSFDIRVYDKDGNPTKPSAINVVIYGE